jgi:uridine kinase
MNASAPIRLVAIVGGSASGKSWLADQLASALGVHAGRLTQDDYYRDWSHLPPEQRIQVNFDHPEALDWFELESALRDLRDGRPCRQPTYDFHTHSRQPGCLLVPPSGIMIVDGLWLLHRPEIRGLFDLSIFLHCDVNERFRRRLARDVAERGRTPEAVHRQFHETVEPMHGQFVDPQARWADVVLTHPYARRDVAALHDALSALLTGDDVLPAGARDSFRSEIHSRLEPAAALP